MSTPANRPILDVALLYRTHGGLVRARIRRFFSGEEAEDVLQEVFVRVMDNIGSFRGESSPSTWLFQITTRYCINRLRDGRRRIELLDRERGGWWEESPGTANQEMRAIFADVWANIDAETAEMATYMYLDGMTRDEVAKLTGVSPRTVSNRLEAMRAAAASRDEKEQP